MSEARITIIFLGIMALVFGGLLLATAYAPGIWEALSGRGYLAEVLDRARSNVLQAGLGIAWCAAIIHGVFIVLFATTSRTALSYNDFAGWAQTVFTSLGFLGTVIGVSQAIAGLPEAMDQQTPDPGLLIEGLSTAFDTTFLGLCAAVTMMVFRKIGRLRWNV